MRFVVKKEEITELSRMVIHLYLNGQTKEFMEYVSKDFVFLADYNMMYLRGADNFAATIQSAEDMPEVVFHEEEFTQLDHSKDLWIVYGRCVMTAKSPDGKIVPIKFHVNLVWKRIDNALRLIQAMACHVLDAGAPPEDQAQITTLIDKNTELKYAANTYFNENESKLCLHDTTGTAHFVYPSEIAYVQGKHDYSFVHTVDGELSVCTKIGQLPLPELFRIHKSYLVNRRHVKSYHTGRVTMTDGTVLPISRNYMHEFRLYMKKTEK